MLPVSAHISGKNLQDDTFYNPTVAEGDAFDGWYEKAEDIGSEAKKAKLPLMLKKYELYGKVETAVNAINVRFVSWDGTKDEYLGSGDVISTNPTASVAIADPVAPEGKEFIGWKVRLSDSPMYAGELPSPR